MSRLKLVAAVCTKPDRYAVFTQQPILGGTYGRTGSWADTSNIQRVHEHIFFCNKGLIEDNIGFGVGQEKIGEFVGSGTNFYYSRSEIVNGVAEDGSDLTIYRPIPNEDVYDYDVLYELLQYPNGKLYPDNCQLNSSAFIGIGNNCQTFTSDIRKDYWEAVAPQITNFYCEGNLSENTCTTSWNNKRSLYLEHKSLGNHSLKWSITGYTDGSTKKGKVEPHETIVSSATCNCEGDVCQETRRYRLVAKVSNNRSEPATAEMIIVCSPTLGQTIENVVEDFIPSIFGF